MKNLAAALLASACLSLAACGPAEEEAASAPETQAQAPSDQEADGIGSVSQGLQSCVSVTAKRTVFTTTVRATNNCSGTVRMKIVVSSYPDSACVSVSPGGYISHSMPPINSWYVTNC